MPASAEAVLAAAGVRLRGIVPDAEAARQMAAIARARRASAAAAGWVPGDLLDAYEAGEIAGPGVDGLRAAQAGGARLVLLHGRGPDLARAAVVALLDGDHPGGRYVRASRMVRLCMSHEPGERADAAACVSTSRLAVVGLGYEHAKLRGIVDGLIAERAGAGRLTVCCCDAEIFPRGQRRWEEWYPESAAMRAARVVTT